MWPCPIFLEFFYLCFDLLLYRGGGFSVHLLNIVMMYLVIRIIFSMAALYSWVSFICYCFVFLFLLPLVFFFLILTWYTSYDSSLLIIAHLWMRWLLSKLEVWKRVSFKKEPKLCSRLGKMTLPPPPFTMTCDECLLPQPTEMATVGCQQCGIPSCLPDRLLPAGGGLSVGVVLQPASLACPGARLGPGHFLPPACAIHSSLPNKGLLFCFMPWPLLWKRGPSPKSLAIGVSSWLLNTASHSVFDSGNLVTFFMYLWFEILVLLKMKFMLSTLFVLRWFLEKVENYFALPFYSHLNTLNISWLEQLQVVTQMYDLIFSFLTKLDFYETNFGRELSGSLDYPKIGFQKWK